MGPTSRPVCCELESTAGTLRQLAAPTGGDGRGCIQPELEPLPGICLPPIFLDSALPEQDKEGSGRDGSDSPDLASATLVPSSVESGVRAPSDFANMQRDPVGSVGMSASASIQSDVVTSRLEIIRGRYEAQGLSRGVVELLLGANRDTTAAAYQSAWNGWSTWCLHQSEDPLSPGLNKVLDFLTGLCNEGKAYRSINVYRSMLSSTLKTIDGFDVGKHPMVMKVMQGIYNVKPPAPKYNNFWDVNEVLKFLDWQANSETPFAKLSSKTVMLLALTSLCRVSELASISRESIAFSSQGVKLSLTRPRKAQRQAALKVFNLKRLDPPTFTCPVVCLEAYVKASDVFRKNDQSLLFLATRSPFRSVGASTIGRWIKTLLAEAGVDTSVYSAHSTRGASASRAASAGVSVENILRSGGWASESVFVRHYRREVDSGREFATAVLQTA